MNCMKCGREIPLGQAFCKDCLADMESYPIKPGTPINLPSPDRTPPPRRNQSSRKPRKPEEQIRLLRKTVFGLTLALLAVVLAFAVTASVLLYQLDKARTDPLPGQNYSTVEDTST